MKKTLANAKNKVVLTANHIHRNRAKYAAAVTAVTVGALVVRNQREFNEFLEERGLLDEYYQFEQE